MLLQRDKSEHFCYKVTEIYLLIMVTAFPLFTGFSGYLYLHMKKYAFFFAVTLIWGIILLVETVRRIKCGEQFSRPRIPELFMLLFMLVAILSTICAPHAAFLSFERYDGLLTYLLYGLVFMGVYRYGKVAACFLYGFATAYAVCCTIALLQLLGWNALWLYPDGMNYYDPVVQETAKFLGTIGNIDVLSSLHCLAIPLLSAVLFLGRARRRRSLIVPIILGLVSQIWAGVSSGLLALGITAIIFFPFGLAVKFPERYGKMRYSGVWILLAAAVLIYFFPLKEGTLYELQRCLHGEFQDEYGSHRILIWRKTIEVIRQHPLLGVGPDSLWHYLDIQFERFSPLLNEMLYSTVDNAHNEYLQMFVNFGVLGVLPLLFLALYTVLRLKRIDEGKKCLIPPLFCYMIQAFFNIGLCITTPFVFIMWGLLLCRNEEFSQ